MACSVLLHLIHEMLMSRAFKMFLARDIKVCAEGGFINLFVPMILSIELHQFKHWAEINHCDYIAFAYVFNIICLQHQITLTLWGDAIFLMSR